MSELTPLTPPEFSFSFLREQFFFWAMSFAKFYPSKLKGHMSHRGGRSSLPAPKTCPSWEFIVGLFSQSALWGDGLLTHFSGQGYAQGAPLRTVRYT